MRSVPASFARRRAVADLIALVIRRALAALLQNCAELRLLFFAGQPLCARPRRLLERLQRGCVAIPLRIFRLRLGVALLWQFRLGVMSRRCRQATTAESTPQPQPGLCCAECISTCDSRQCHAWRVSAALPNNVEC